MISATDSGIQAAENPPFTTQWNKPMLGRPSYPIAISFADRLILRNPRLARAIGRQLQLVYDAYVEGEQATAWVEIDCR